MTVSAKGDKGMDYSELGPDGSPVAMQIEMNKEMSAKDKGKKEDLGTTGGAKEKGKPVKKRTAGASKKKK